MLARRSLFIFVLLLITLRAVANTGEGVSTFIDKMVKEHGFKAAELESLFNQTRVSRSILDAISRPAEKLPWHKYRKIFLRRDRIEQGVEFWHENMHILDRAEEIYGVPPEIIVAIIGVETQYGRFTGKYRVMDALTTLGFHYPKRSAFFKGQLEQYLLLAREQKLDPLSLKGSYAGAMGIPQFIPGSYRSYAADFDEDGTINIWTSMADAIGSVARYFQLHGWKSGGMVAQPAIVTGSAWKSALSEDLEPDLKVEQLSQFSVRPSASVDNAARVKLIELEQRNGPEIWLGFDNFYVITRYNHSALYAMAVYQLSREIEKSFRDKS